MLRVCCERLISFFTARNLCSIESNFSSVADHPNLSPAPDHEFASRWYTVSVNRYETSLLQILPIYTSILLKTHVLIHHCYCNRAKGIGYGSSAAGRASATATSRVLSRATLARQLLCLTICSLLNDAFSIIER
jgi:hypothetical protein